MALIVYKFYLQTGGPGLTNLST